MSKIYVKDFMSKELKTINYDENVEKASKIMLKNRIGVILVKKNNDLVGIVSDGDILKKVISKNLKASEVIVESIMSSPVEKIEQDTLAEDAAKYLREKKLKKLLVIKNNKPVGFFSMEDLVKETVRNQKQKFDGWANGIVDAWNAF